MDGPRAVWVDGFTGPRQTTNITETFETAVESPKASKKHVIGRRWQRFEPAEFLGGPARQTGTRVRVPMAAGFEVHGLGEG